MSRLVLAAAQIECIPGDIGANRALHVQAIAEARARGADVLVFPELSLPDYLSAPDLGALAMSAADPILGTLAAAAGDLTVFLGFVEKAGGCHFIATATLSGGRITHVHRKVNLATYGNLQEGRFYDPGDAIELVEVKGWRGATLICADAWNPALPWIAALKGAELAVIPVASAIDAVDGAFENPAGWEATLRQIAVTYAMPTIMVNHCGARGGLRFWGGSRILDPFGRELACAGAHPDLLLAAVDYEEMRLARERLPTIRDANPSLIARLLGETLAVPA